MILAVWGGSGQRFMHTRRCRFGAPQIRPRPVSGRVRGVRVVRTKGVWPGHLGPDVEVGVVTENWAEPARMMVQRLLLDAGPDGLSGLWSLAKAAQQATLRLALDPAADPDLSMTHAGMDLGELLEELEWSHPAVPTLAAAVDLGDPPADPGACRDIIAFLLVGALEVTATILRAPAGESATSEILMLARVVHLLSSAHLRVAGRLP